MLRMDRGEFDAGALYRTGYLNYLRKDATKDQTAGITEQVMLSFTTDVYSPSAALLTRDSIKVLIEHGMGFCTLTKGGTRALRDLRSLPA